jgi:hypothetical protein
VNGIRDQDTAFNVLHALNYLHVLGWKMKSIANYAGQQIVGRELRPERRLVPVED